MTGALRERSWRRRARFGAIVVLTGGLAIAGVSQIESDYTRDVTVAGGLSAALAAAVVGAYHAMSRERAVERRLADSEARNAAAMDAALDAVVVMDADGTVRALNPAAIALFGYAGAEAIGRPLADLIVPPALRDAHRAGLARYRTTLEPRILGQRLELAAVRRDGSEFPAEITVVRVGAGDRDDAPIFIGFIRDITERRQAAEAESLRRATKAAEAANVELEAFSYTVAHQLRAPLRAMNGFAQAMIEEYTDRLEPAAIGHLERVAGAAVRMSRLIDGLLELARIAKADLAPAAVDLTALAHTAARAVAADPGDREVEWAFAAGVTARGDARLLRTAIDHLVGNAWKFSRDARPARIELGTTTEAGATVYFVRDNGVGFDMAHAGQLFAPFERLHGDCDLSGTGVGLATVDRIVRRHGGRVWADSAPGRGTTIYFTLEA